MAFRCSATLLRPRPSPSFLRESKDGRCAGNARLVGETWFSGATASSFAFRMLGGTVGPGGNCSKYDASFPALSNSEERTTSEATGEDAVPAEKPTNGALVSARKESFDEEFKGDDEGVGVGDESDSPWNEMSSELFRSIMSYPDDAMPAGVFQDTLLQFRTISLHDRMELVRRVCLYGKVKLSFEIVSFLSSHHLLFSDSFHASAHGKPRLVSSEARDISSKETELIACLLNSFFKTFQARELARYLAYFPAEKSPIYFRHLHHMALEYAANKNPQLSIAILKEIKTLGFPVPLSTIVKIANLSQRGRLSAEYVVDAMEQLKGEKEGNEAYFLAQLHHCEKARQEERIKFISEKMIHLNPNPSLKTLNRILFSFGKTGMVDSAEEWILRIGKLELRPNVYSFTGLMLAYCISDRLPEAEKIFERMKTCGVRPDSVIVGTLLNAYAQKGDADAVNRVFDEMKSVVDPDAGWFVSKMIAHRKNKRLGSALRASKELRASRVQPNIWALNLTIDLYGEMPCIKKVEKEFKMMEQSSVHPTISSYNSLLGAYVAIKDMSRAREVFQTMQQLNGISPDIFTYNTLMSGYATMGDVKACQELYNSMIEKKVRPNAATCHIIVRVLCMKETIDSGLNFLQNFIEKDNSVDSIEMYNALISAASKQGKTKLTFSLYSSLIEKKMKPNINTINILMNSCSAVGDVRLASEIFKSIPLLDLKPDVISYTTLMKTLIQSGKLSEVQEVYDSMILNGFKPDHRAKDMLRRAKRYIKSNKLPRTALRK